MSNNGPTKVSSTKMGTMKIPYSDLEKHDSRTCQNCYHVYKDHIDENGQIIPCQKCDEDPCKNFQG